MPLTEDYSDPEDLLRDAISSIAVRAYSRGINIASHIDYRLPNRVAAVEAGLGEFLRRGLLRTVDAGRTGKIALALWSGETDPDGTIRAQVEICRSRAATPTVCQRQETKQHEVFFHPMYKTPDGSFRHRWPGRQRRKTQVVVYQPNDAIHP